MYEIKDESLSEIKGLIRNIKQKVYICGAGYRGEMLARWFDLNNFEWEGFIDKNKIGKLCDKPIFPYKKISEESCKIYVWISSSLYQKEMMADIRNYDVNGNIFFITFYDAMAFQPILHEYFDNIDDKSQEMRLCKLKDIHLGRRAFIIGNGPSLSISDLDKIENEISFGVNTIYYTYEYTRWRPTYYVCEDSFATYHNLNSQDEFYSVIKESDMAFFSKYSSKYLQYGSANGQYNNLCFFNRSDLRLFQKDYIAPFSTDISKIVYSIGTVIYSVYQIAAYMGIKVIYLVGMDCSFAKEIDINGNYFEHNERNNYTEIIQKKQGNSSIYLRDQIFCAHKSAKNYTEAHGIKIYNATRGGKLDIFPRVDFDKLF